MTRVPTLVVLGMTVAAFAASTAAFADAPNENSGHNPNGDAGCESSVSIPNCPHVGMWCSTAWRPKRSRAPA